jgi:L-arabinose isomerase
LQDAQEPQGYSPALTVEHLEDYAKMAGIAFLLIDRDTRVRTRKQELHWNDMYYLLAKGL